MELLSALAGLLQTPNCVPYVLFVCKHLPDPSVLVRAGIVPLLAEAVAFSPPHTVQDWFQTERDRFLAGLGSSAKEDSVQTATFSTFQELCDFIVATELAPFQFQNSKFLSQIHEFLAQGPTITPRELPALEKVVGLLHGALDFLPNPVVPERFSGSTPGQLCGKSVHG